MIVLSPEKPYSRADFSATATDPTAAAAQEALDWSRLPGGVVDGGEIVLLAIKPSLWRPIIESLGWIAACAILSLTAVRLGYAVPGLSLTATVQLIIFTGVCRLGWALLRWIPRWYVLTNRRIMDIEGVREPHIWACPLVDVRNSYINASPLERLLATGTVTIVTSDAAVVPRFWHTIARPETVHAAIRRAIEEAIDRQGRAD